MKPYNPLDRNHLADSIAREFFKRDLAPLPPESFAGAGIYAIYYGGDFPLYADVARSLRAYEATLKRKGSAAATKQPTPLYVGKSDPPGSRKGLFADSAEQPDEEEAEERASQEAEELLTETPKHRKLFSRLKKHSVSVSMTQNLRLEDFKCRYMLVDEIWVPLGEARLVARFRPVWNVLVEGFGSNPEGGGRKDTARSVWDILHPGRKEALGIQVAPDVEAKIVADIRSAKGLGALAKAVTAHREAKQAFRKLRKKSTAPKADGPSS